MQIDYSKYTSRTFIEVPSFTKKWFDLGFTDDDLTKLENKLMEDPEAGVLMANTGGIRKIRIAFNGKGKRGGARVCYVDFATFEKTYFIDVFTKNEKENLSKEECNELKGLIKILKEESSKKGK